MNNYEYVIIASIVSMLFGINAKIIYDWLRVGRVNGNEIYVRKDLCETKYQALADMIRVELKNIYSKLDEIKEEIRR